MGLERLQRPIFLFSLPRSGSTLTQRILAAHEEIATAAEPWILLPYLYTLRDHGIYTEYEHGLATKAIEHFYQSMPEGREEYLSELRNFVLRLYAKASGSDARYFLDKTPRYALIAEDVIRLFPEGKFVFLWRNPLAVAASVIETPWARKKGGKWNLYRWKNDLFVGLENLVEAYQRHSTKAHAVRYEDLIVSPAEEVAKICDYLGLPFDPATLEDFGEVKLQGFKDPTGTKLYSQVSRESLKKWKRTLTNPVRKAWCRRYLRWIGKERLAVMGYELDELLAELDSIPTSSRRLGSDFLSVGYGLAYSFLEPAIYKDKLNLLPAWHRIHRHH